MLFNEDNIIRNKIKNFRLLNEYVDRNEVINAIKNRDIVYIYYGGDDTVNRGYRTIEPYLIGTTKKGNLALRAWQQAGASDTKKNASRKNDEIPGWRLFLLDGITSFMKTMKKYNPDKPRPNYNPQDQGMNSIIYAFNPADQDTDIKMIGGNSMTEPNVIKTEVPADFDVQAKKFSSFYNSEENKEKLAKKRITDLYELVRYQYKKSPKDYIVIDRNGQFWIDKKVNRPRYDNNEVYGVLDDMYKTYTGLKPFDRINKDFIRRQREEFKKMIEKNINR